MRPSAARALWHRLETIHSVTYFAPECREANKAVGLRGFWMGYFASRAAPLGLVGPGVIEALFFNFAPAFVRRAIPDAWSFVTPEAVVRARRTAAAAALRRAVRGVRSSSESIAVTLHRVIAAAEPAGRPLFAANRDLPAADDPVEALWQATTTLREHRGDGHVSTLTAAGLDGCAAHVLVAASGAVPADVLRENRGWTPDEWAAAADRLRGRGWVDAGGGITPAGRRIRARIERTTDELALPPFLILDAEALEKLYRDLQALARRIVGSGVIPFPNPMGLPERWTRWPGTRA